MAKIPFVLLILVEYTVLERRVQPLQWVSNQPSINPVVIMGVQSTQNRWDEVANGIQGNEFYLREIVYELRMFNEEIKYIRNTVYLGDSEVFNFLNRLSHAIHRYELTQPEYDDIKSFCGFLWSVFTGWNFVDGYKNRDYIEKMLAKATKT